MPAQSRQPHHRPETPEVRICGLAAVRARFARDPASIRRLYFDYPTGRRIGLMCKALAASRRIYRCVEPAELEKLAGSLHHGGIVLVAAAAPLAPARPEDAARWAARREPLLILDRVGNAHNLGAIARTAAFLGVPRILISDHPSSARPNDAAYRVAEGGLEFVDVRLMGGGASFLPVLTAAGYDVVGAAARGGEVMTRRAAEAARAGRDRPVALVLGNEEDGLAPEVSAACTRLVTLEGAKGVESLNVSAAAAVLIWELLAGSK